jgi:hypothetical protein
MRSQPQLAFGFAAAPPPSDITINRHKGNRHSVAANRKAEPGKASMRERIRIFVAGCGFHGTTLKEICANFHKLPNEISGRISELKADQEIFDGKRGKRAMAVRC